MSREKKNLGDWGEKVAVKELKKLGWSILETNYFTRYGEIDIIAKDKETLVFVEVKTRANNWNGEASESVTKTKQRHCMKAVEVYLKKNGYEDLDIEFRIDLATLDKKENGNWKFCLIQNAIGNF